MSFVLLLITGFVSGIIGGMGMGGGTILIPALTLLLGVEQRLAQATNVIAFLPMAALALPKHRQNGLLRTDKIAFVIIPALLASAAFGVLMAALPPDALRKVFGVFLIALGVKQLFDLKNKLVG